MSPGRAGHCLFRLGYGATVPPTHEEQLAGLALPAAVHCASGAVEEFIDQLFGFQLQ